jgi:hypothetical protein
MTDQDLRQVVLGAIPPLPSPPDRIQSIARRVRRERRRIVVVSVAAGTTIVVGSIAAFGMASPSAVAPAATASASPFLSPSPQPTSSPSTVVGGPPAEGPKQGKIRLKAAVEASVHRIVPGAAITQRFPVQYTNASGIGYNVGQLITANGRRGDLVVTIELTQSFGEITCAAQVAPGRQSRCKDRTGPHGEHIVSLPSTGDGPGNRTNLVRVLRTDGSIVTVECGNDTRMEVPLGPSGKEPSDSPTDFGITTSSPTGKQPPCTIDQVTALALDPTITLYPH